MMEFVKNVWFKKNDGCHWEYNDYGVLESVDEVANCYE